MRIHTRVDANGFIIYRRRCEWFLLHLATVYRKLERYEQTSRVSDLTPTKHTGGKGRSRLAPEADAIVDSLVKEVYVNKQKRSIKKTADEIRRSFAHAELKPPHYNTIRNRVLAVSERERNKERLGAKAASEKHDAFPGQFPGADWPLAVVQIDHTKFDIMLVDDIHRLCIGRPWITLAIDVFSRMVVGIYISLEPPNSIRLVCASRMRSCPRSSGWQGWASQPAGLVGA